MKDCSFGMIGLGKMGALAAEHIVSQNICLAVYDMNQEQVQTLAGIGAKGCRSLSELINSLAVPRIVWLMVPAGSPVDEVLFGKEGIVNLLQAGDIVIDAGNSFYHDTHRRAEALNERGIHYLDSGSSGGQEGAKKGLCLMIGGEKKAFMQAEVLFQALTSGIGGYAYVGPSGAGHFSKMVHNAIEYGMLQALGEGFELLSAGPYKYDLQQIAHLWTQGSIVRGYLMELLEQAFTKDGTLRQITGEVGGGSTGSWAIEEAWKFGVPFETIALSFAARLRSRQDDTFSGKVVAALRNEFGGHAVTEKKL